MVNLVVSTFISGGSLSIYLDNQLVIQNSDSVTLELPEQGEYIVHWFVKGEAGITYSINISSPKDAQLQFTRAVPKAKKDIGSFKFAC